MTWIRIRNVTVVMVRVYNFENNSFTFDYKTVKMYDTISEEIYRSPRNEFEHFQLHARSLNCNRGKVFDVDD